MPVGRGTSTPGFTLRKYSHFLPRPGARGSAAIDVVLAWPRRSAETAQLGSWPAEGPKSRRSPGAAAAPSWHTGWQVGPGAAASAPQMSRKISICAPTEFSRSARSS